MALGTYNTDGTKQTQKEYYAGNQKGNYQFISITDIINNFIVSQVGDDKIIKSAKRAEVAFHAQRGIQELNYDTINNLKTQEIDFYPNPNNGTFTLNLIGLESENIEYKIIDIQGKNIITDYTTITNGLNKIEISTNLKAGLYFIEFANDRIKFVVQ